MAETHLSPSPSTALKPVLRAYVFAYLSTASPQILSLILSAARGKISLRYAISRCKNALRQEARFDRLPAAFAVLTGGATVLARVVDEFVTQYVVSVNVKRRYKTYKDYIVKFVVAFGSAWACFHILNLNPSYPIRSKSESESFNHTSGSLNSPESAKTRRRRRSSVALVENDHITPTNIPILAGKTMDLTTFTIVRASGILMYWGWQSHSRKSNSKMRHYVEKLTAPTFFALSSFIIMWNWFYSPDRLPRSYCNWISSAAQIDRRLIEALRQCRFGTFIYGKDTGMAPLLGSLANELGFPEEWGDPAKTIPIPCELYHCGAGPSCEWHAITRFVSSWKFSMKMYLPLNILMLSRRQPSTRSVGRAFTDAAQSSAFLAAFVALFYYGVCCTRTRIGPKLFSRDSLSPQMCDGGMCVDVGCMACGWSLLLEKPGRRPEIAFFVAPRALSTILPRRYDRKFIRREQMAFAVSAAVILTAAQNDPNAVHGVFGRLLGQIFT